MLVLFHPAFTYADLVDGSDVDHVDECLEDCDVDGDDGDDNDDDDDLYILSGPDAPSGRRQHD